MNTIEAIGLISAFLTTSSFFPQFIRIFRTKDVSSISLPMYLMQFFGVAGWVYYGIGTSVAPVYIANGIILPLVFGIVWMKIYYGKINS